MTLTFEELARRADERLFIIGEAGVNHNGSLVTAKALVDVAVELLHELARRSGSTLNSMLAPIVSTSLRLTIIVLVLLEIATAVSDQPPSALIAGLGAGGLAIGLAARPCSTRLAPNPTPRGRR